MPRREPRPDEYAAAMGCFSPEMLPVLSTLARGFAVYDAWFCAVPAQTFCNRSFFAASSSSGFVTNSGGPDGYLKWEKNTAVTIFNRLEDLLGGVFRREPGDLAHRLHPRAGARAILEDALPDDDAVPRGRGRGPAPGV